MLKENLIEAINWVQEEKKMLKEDFIEAIGWVLAGLWAICSIVGIVAIVVYLTTL